jgi:hypothetical protein
MKHNEYLSDDTIHYYLQKLCSLNVDWQSIHPQISTLTGSANYDAVKLYLRDLPKTDNVLVPFLVNNNHWILFSSNNVDKVIHCFDPLMRELSTESEQTILTIICEYYNSQSNNYKIVYSLDHPTQNDGSSCGVFICHYAKRLVTHSDLVFDNTDPLALRKELVDDMTDDSRLIRDDKTDEINSLVEFLQSEHPTVCNHEPMILSQIVENVSGNNIVDNNDETLIRDSLTNEDIDSLIEVLELEHPPVCNHETLVLSQIVENVSEYNNDNTVFDNSVDNNEIELITILSNNVVTSGILQDAKDVTLNHQDTSTGIHINSPDANINPDELFIRDLTNEEIDSLIEVMESEHPPVCNHETIEMPQIIDNVSGANGRSTGEGDGLADASYYRMVPPPPLPLHVECPDTTKSKLLNDWRQTSFLGTLNEREIFYRSLFQQWDLSKSWTNFEQLISDLTIDIKGDKNRFVKSNKSNYVKPQMNKTSGNFNDKEASRIQRSYKMSKKRTFNEVLGNASAKCNVPADKIENYFRQVFSSPENNAKEPDSLAQKYLETYKIKECFSSPFTAAEVKTIMKGLRNSAPGEDGLLYSNLIAFDPDGHILAYIYNVCRENRRIPSVWKNSQITLIHKKGDPTCLDNWRPIALSNTLYKVYTRLWASRLMDELVPILSPEQKGFMATEGCLEHIFVLDTLINNARQKKSDISLVWLDLCNAFGSVPHSLIQANLLKLGFPQTFIDIVNDIYTDSTCQIRHANGLTDRIPIFRGVKQGDPLSPLLFNIAIEPVIRAVKCNFQVNNSLCST